MEIDDLSHEVKVLVVMSGKVHKPHTLPGDLEYLHSWLFSNSDS